MPTARDLVRKVLQRQTPTPDEPPVWPWVLNLCNLVDHVSRTHLADRRCVQPGDLVDRLSRVILLLFRDMHDGRRLDEQQLATASLFGHLLNRLAPLRRAPGATPVPTVARHPKYHQPILCFNAGPMPTLLRQELERSA